MSVSPLSTPPPFMMQNNFPRVLHSRPVGPSWLSTVGLVLLLTCLAHGQQEPSPAPISPMQQPPRDSTLQQGASNANSAGMLEHGLPPVTIGMPQFQPGCSVPNIIRSDFSATSVALLVSELQQVISTGGLHSSCQYLLFLHMRHACWCDVSLPMRAMPCTPLSSFCMGPDHDEAPRMQPCTCALCTSMGLAWSCCDLRDLECFSAAPTPRHYTVHMAMQIS